MATTSESSASISRPTLLTLQGLYSTTKSVYSTYIPQIASSLIERVATKVIATVPVVAKVVLPESEDKKQSVPGDLNQLDSLLVSFFIVGDAKIDDLLTETVTYYDTTKQAMAMRADSAKASVANKLSEAKSYVFGRYNEVKPLVATKVEEAKAVVVKRLDDPEVVKILDRATPYYTAANETFQESTTFMKENMEPAKAVIADMCTSAKSAIAEQGVVGCARVSAEVCKTQTLASVEVLKTKGAVNGTKAIGTSVLTAVTAALDEHKVKVPEPAEEQKETEEEFEDSCGVAE